MAGTRRTTSVLAEHYKAIGREEKAAAIRTWLNAVGNSLKADYEAKMADGPAVDAHEVAERAELRGAMAIIDVLLDRMNEASDAAPVQAGE